MGQVGRALELDNTPADANGYRLGAVTGAELFHDVLDVYFHRLFGDEKLVGDIAIAVAAGDLTQYFHLAPGKSFVTVMFGQMGRDFMRDPLLPGMYLSDVVNHVFGRHAFEHVGACSRFQGTLNLYVSFERCQDDDARFR